MNNQRNLTIAQAIFAFLIFIALGTIVVTEKAGGLLIPKAQKKFEDYLDTTYSDLKNEILKDEVQYKNATYSMKVKSKNNKNHYFYIYYSNKKITDTYKEDYLKGKNLLKYIKKSLEKEILNKTNISCTITINNTLDKYTDSVKEKIINEDNLLNLKFYTINKELEISTWDSKTISNEIDNLINTMTTNNITPKYFNITITNKNDITESIVINNITNNYPNNLNKLEIINAILNKNNNKLLEEENITYKYLN
jgi:hypothetical protein